MHSHACPHQYQQVFLLYIQLLSAHDCVPAGCLVLALLQALASSGGGPTTADSSCQTSRPGQLDGLKGRLLQLEDAYMAKVGFSCYDLRHRAQ